MWIQLKSANTSPDLTDIKIDLENKASKAEAIAYSIAL